MKNDLILKRKLKIETWLVKASIAEAESRPELMPVLKRLQEAKQSDAEDIAGHLLFDPKSRRVVAERMLEITERYGLSENVSSKYSLTEEGRQAVEEKKVFVPAEGTWEISFSSDQLLPYPVIKFKSHKEPSANDEIRGKGAKGRTDERKKSIQEIPDWIKKSEGKKAMPCYEGEPIRIDHIDQKAEKVNSSLNLVIEWNVTKGTLQLKDDKETINYFDPPNSWTKEEVWERLLDNEGRLQNWNSVDETLSINFDDTDEKSRISMQGDVEFDETEIPELESFDRFIAEGVSLRAETQEDAQKWASWRLEHSITGYATDKNYQKWVENAQSPFKAFEVNLPERDVLAKDLWEKQQDKTSWFLVTATDWNL